MRRILISFAILASVVTASAQAPSERAAASPALAATDVTDKAIQAFIAAMPKDAITDSPIRIVDVGGSRIGIYGVFLPKSMPGDAIAHETRTSEVYYMLEGSGTLVTGGSIADPKPPPPGRGSGPRGERIEAGVSRRVSKGDLIVIPGRTPHWWSSLDSDIKYLIIRSDPDNRLTLK